MLAAWVLQLGRPVWNIAFVHSTVSFACTYPCQRLKGGVSFSYFVLGFTCPCLFLPARAAEKLRELERIRAGKEMQKIAEKEKEMALKRMIEVRQEPGTPWHEHALQLQLLPVWFP